jgi:hypothetical protein
MIRRRRPRRAFAMALMLVVLMVLTVITVTLVGTGVRDQQSARLSAGRSEARLLAASVFEDFFSRLKEDPTGLYDLLGSNETDGLAGSVFAGYNTAFRRTTTPKWAVLPSIGRVSQTAVPGAVGSTACAVDDFTQDCFHVEIPSADRLGPTNAPGSFLLRVNMRLRCGGVEARCIYSSFEQRVRRVQFYDFALANEFSTLAPSALFPQGSYVDSANVNHRNFQAFKDYEAACVKPARARTMPAFSVFTGTTDFTQTDTGSAFAWDGIDPGLELTGCVDIAYTADSSGIAGRTDTLNDASIYVKDDWISVCGSPRIGSVFLSGGGFGNPPKVYTVPSDCADPSSGFQPVTERNVPVMALPSGNDVLTATGVQSPPTLTSGTPEVIDLSGKSGLLVYRGDGIASTLDAVIFGEVSANVSVVVQGSVAIIGDIRYRDRSQNHLLSLTASERIEIWQSCSGGTGTPEPPTTFGDPTKGWSTSSSCIPGGPVGTRVVNGILTSPEGFIGTPDWLTNVEVDATGANQRTQSTLEFYGSMTAKFQGVFGGYTAQNGTTELISGFFKNFEHDKRLTQLTNGDASLNLTLPPYLVESATPVWVRLDLSEVSYQGS